MDPNEQVLMRFAQCLASNEKKYRDRAVAKLKKWLQSKCSDDMTDGDLMKVWKGLHYCMWMSDKPLVQEELAERLSKLVHLLPSVDLALRFVECFLWTEIREWHGIDTFRIDKFMMLIRLYWRESLELLKKSSWSKHEALIDIIGRTLVSVDDDRVSDGLRYFMIDIFWDELTKIGAEELEPEQVTEFLDPFCALICHTRNKTLMNRVIKEIFVPPLEWAKEDAMIDELLEDEDEMDEEQSDDDDNEVEEESEEEDEEAEESGEEGEEQMELNGIEEAPSRCQIDLAKLAERLFELASDSKTPSSNRTRVYNLVKRYHAANEGDFSREEKVLPTVPKKGALRTGQITQAAESLMKFENKLMEDTRKGKKRKAQDASVPESNGLKNVKKQKKGKENKGNNSNDSTENSVKETTSKQATPVPKKSEKKKRKEKEPSEQQKTAKKSSPKSNFDLQKAKTTKTPESKPKNRKSDALNITTLNATPKNDKKLKNKKSEILGEALETSTPIITSNKKAKKSPKNSVEDDTPIVNKKKKGALDRLSMSPKNSAKKSNSSFANFDSNVTPPAAFVKKAVAKTEPKKKSKLSRSESMKTPQTDGKKRVSFIMARNTAQEFEDSFSASPTPFNPFILPENGILKPSPMNSPVLKKKVITRRRSTAADFF